MSHRVPRGCSPELDAQPRPCSFTSWSSSSSTPGPPPYSVPPFARALAGGLPSRRGYLVGPAPERSGGAPACPCRPALPAARAARQGRLEDVQKVLTAPAQVQRDHGRR
jgi:hypothetical protein